MKSFIRFFFILTFLFTFNSCNESLVEDMVQFDRAYIPVFYNICENDVDKAQVAMHQLDKQWQYFNKKYTNKVVYSEDWQESIRLINQWLQGTNCALKDNEMEEALVQLDHARYEMADIRWRTNIPYYLDYVWDLESAIHVAVQISTDPMIDLRDWCDFVVISNGVLEAYDQLSEQKLDEQLYKISKTDSILLKERQQALKEKIDVFIKAVDCADGALFTVAAEQLKPAFFNYLNLFGDFKSIQSYYAFKN